MPKSRIFDAGPGSHRRRLPALLLLSGLFLPLPIPPAFAAQAKASGQSFVRDPFAAHIADAARRFGIPAAWIRAVMRAESAGDPRAVSPKGAIGLMQIMPATWADLRARHRLGHDPYDPRDNILAGAGYLRELYDRYGSPGFLAAYNAGPGRYEQSIAKGRALPAETRAYVAALVPFSGSGDAAPVVIAAADPSNWTRAPLFVAPSGRARSVEPVSSAGSSSDTSAATNVRDISAIEPQAGGLFIVRRAPGGTR